MEILSLTDNLYALPGFKAYHGRSLYIKSKKHKILFNLGQDETFIRNAQKLGVDIADIDTVIISHGHYDHGGELAAFICITQQKRNTQAKISFPTLLKILTVSGCIITPATAQESWLSLK